MKPNKASDSNSTGTISRRTMLKSTAGIAGIASVLTGGKAASAAQISKPYDYPKKHLWDVKRVWNINEQPKTMRERMPQAGNPNFYLDRLIDSHMGESLVVMFENFINYTNEMDPELLKYYANLGKGLKKELFQADAFMERWSCYTPLSMYRPESKGRKYPFMFVLHGGNCSIEWEEANGFLPLAARDEVIAVAPQNHSVPNLMRILSEVKSKYPVDESRIYSIGYSQGGNQTNLVTLAHPEIFAACAPGPGPFPGGGGGAGNPDPLSDEVIENFKKYTLPMISVGGQTEMTYIYPFTADRPAQAGGPAVSANSSGKGKIDRLQRRLRAMRCREPKAEEFYAMAKSDDIVKRKMEVPFDRTSVEKILGVDHYIGDFKNDQGDYYMRMISIENMPHWLHPTTAELAWKFMKRFSRDPVTKKLIVSA
jgi:poly(3-hydroxybutyrate) depolymerase